MEFLQIGSIAVLLKWVLLGIAVTVGLFFFWIWSIRMKGAEQSKQIYELLFNSVFAGFIAWKGSLLLLEPMMVLNNPLTLLYFSGGKDGLVIAVIFAVLYFSLKASKEGICGQLKMRVLFVYSSMVLGIYHLLFAMFLQEDLLFHILIGLAALLASIFNRKLQDRKKLLSFVILFSFYYLILSQSLLHPVNQILLFTSDQWLFFILILLSLYYLQKVHKEEENE